MNDDKWMEEARQIAAQCWCDPEQIAAQCWYDPETSGIEMDARLAGAFARRFARLREENERLAARLAEVEEEANRYRWLRDIAPEKWATWADERDGESCTPAEIDEAIDRARKE